MKRGWIVFFAVLYVAAGAILWEFGPALLFIFMMATDPNFGGCDEGPVTDRSAPNGRGDVVAEYLRACTGIGTVVDYSIELRLHGDKKTTKLADYDDAQYDYPKFRWIDDDTLIVDLGKVAWASPKTDKVGSIHITYAFIQAETNWW